MVHMYMHKKRYKYMSIVALIKFRKKVKSHYEP